MDQFIELPRSIRLNCGQQIHGDAASCEANNEVLKRAYNEYRLPPAAVAFSDEGCLRPGR